MLIANMIGKDEADRFLEPVLSRLRNMVHLIIFTDDCSSDNTPAIAEKYGANVLQTERPLFEEHEGALRSLAWQHLAQYADVGDWILAIDCDEMIYGTEKFGVLLDQTRFDVLGVKFYHMWDHTHYRTDKAWAPDSQPRLFRYYADGEYLNKRLACGSTPTYVQELIRQNRVLWDTGLRCKHLGYVRDQDKMMKFKRYQELDGGRFHSRMHLDSILDPSPTLEPWLDI